ncbi:unnamed protein product [Linum tenue]|uniref:S-protein homolog n=1 Tax=Linum tenue TaxID=586396 RepID=A0AAV0RNX9_9ROSI|nr:unnamed protein product [Linum tenue]
MSVDANPFDPRFKKTTVVVENDIEGRELAVHCKSRDDDLHLRRLQPHRSFDFTFRPTFLETTLFYCSFDWGEGVRWFDIYIQDRDYHICKWCRWLVRRDAVCLTSDWNQACYYYKRR